MSTPMHFRTCAHLVKNAACDCGHVCPVCGGDLPCHADHANPTTDVNQIRDRLDSGDASRDEILSDARALLALVDRLAARLGSDSFTAGANAR